MAKIDKRYDFVLFFDVQDGNPNGDPDAGNLPRIDAETGKGLVTDVCIKRKVRNYVQLVKTNDNGNKTPGENENHFDIYIKEKTVLGHAHVKAFNELGISLGEPTKKIIPDELISIFQEIPLPEGLQVEEDEDEKHYLIVELDADKKIIKDAIKDDEIFKDVRKFISDVLKISTSRKPTSAETESGRMKMCQNFYDIRTFGAVLSLKSAPNCGQVRGPIQMTFARSVEPVVALEHAITRVAKTTEERAAKGGSEMGRKFTVPYGLYRAHGFISAHLAEQTKFDSYDLDLFWKALQEMFDHDHSAARGLMSTRQIVVFKHATALGNKPAHELFDRVTWKRTTEGPARDYADYEILLDGKKIDKRFKEEDVS